MMNSLKDFLQNVIDFLYKLMNLFPQTIFKDQIIVNKEEKKELVISGPLLFIPIFDSKKNFLSIFKRIK